MTNIFRSIVKPVCSLVIGGMLIQCISFACLACISAEAQPSTPMDCCPSQHSQHKSDSLLQKHNCHDEVDHCTKTVSSAIDNDLGLSLFGFADPGLSIISNSQTVINHDLSQLTSSNQLSHLSGIPIYLSCCSFLE